MLLIYITIYLIGVPSLKRTELEAACEDFSNVIGTSSMGTVYKGTLSTGVEIAVTSLAVESAKEWPENLEAQFRKKVYIYLFSEIFCSIMKLVLTFQYGVITDLSAVQSKSQEFREPYWLL